MEAILVNLVILGLMVFVFGVISRSRTDDRLRCWRAAWACVFAHMLVRLPVPGTTFGQQLQSFALATTLALAGICFIVSSMILREGRSAGLRLGWIIAAVTLPLIALVAFGCTSVWVLSTAVVARQLVAAAQSSRVRHNRLLITPILWAMFTAIGAWSLFAILHGQPTGIVLAMLAELYVCAAIDFWCNGWKHTIGLHTMAGGLMAAALVFPLWEAFQRYWVHFTFAPTVWNMPKFCVASGMILMILEEDARACRQLSDEYQMVFHNNPQPLWIFENVSLRFVAANQAALDLHGYTREEFMGLTLTDVADPAAEFDGEVTELADAGPHRMVRHIRKNGTTVPLSIEERDILFEGKSCRFVLGLDMTEREALQKQLLRQARHDALTGLPNRMLFEEKLAAAVAHTKVGRQKLAILCLDVCRFQHINDAYGHRVGDECIQYIAGVLANAVRAGDIVARTGGDEFAIVLKGVRSAAAVKLMAAALRKKFKEPVNVQGRAIQLYFSMGLAIFPDDGTDALALWQGAESMLRRAQEEGGGQSFWLSPELRAEAEQQIEIESSMRKNIEEAGFHLAYQPVYGFDGRIRSLEALLRFDHAIYGRVSPSKVIPIAEETGLILQMGLWVIHQVCVQLRIWSAQGMKLVPVAINVSTLQLMQSDFADQVMQALTHYQIDPRWIHLEVTETAAMRNVKEVSGQMAALAAVGISFSIDDFGTGHSSLGRLHQLPISVLKIDRSFVEKLSGTSDSYTPFTIVQAILSMAHALGQKVIAEGVETPAQLACLRGLNCDLLQGYLLSRPISPEQVPALAAQVHPAFADVPQIECFTSKGTRTSYLLD